MAPHCQRDNITVCLLFHKIFILCAKKWISDGNWSIWSAWSTCSVTCGNGNQTQTRTCSNPSPANGGKNCSAFNTETVTQACTSQPCPVGKKV